jgi:hypothetical protein
VDGVRKAFAVKLPFTAIYEGPTVALLAKVIQVSPPEAIDETLRRTRSASTKGRWWRRRRR